MWLQGLLSCEHSICVILPMTTLKPQKNQRKAKICWNVKKKKNFFFSTPARMWVLLYCTLSKRAPKGQDHQYTAFSCEGTICGKVVYASVPACPRLHTEPMTNHSRERKLSLGAKNRWIVSPGSKSLLLPFLSLNRGCVCTRVCMHVLCTLKQNKKTSDSKAFPLSNYGLGKS